MTRHLKIALASMILVGSMSFLTLSGVFAVMSGDGYNHASIATGTLTLSNTVESGTACFSYQGAANSNASCDRYFTNSTLRYPGTLATAKLTITNNGSLDATSLYVYMPSCTKTTSPGAPAPGGGDPCGLNGLQLYLQETNSSWTATTCRYPAAAGSCALNASTLYAFANTYTSSGAVLTIPGGLAHGASRYFIVGMQLPSNASNALQGQEADFDLTWGMST